MDDAAGKGQGSSRPLFSLIFYIFEKTCQTRPHDPDH
jgi:hypothetical protein